MIHRETAIRAHTSADMDAAVADYIDSGNSIRAVARRHPVPEDAFRAELKRRDVVRRPGSTVPDRVKDAAVADFLDGMTIAQVAYKHAVARSSVASWLEDRGVGKSDRIGESPDVYDAGWVRDGLVWRPVRPVGRVAA